MKAKLGIAPIAWWNDDLAELSRRRVAGGMPAPGERRRLHRHGEGAALPARLPRCWADPRRATASRVCGGWFSGLLLDGDIAAEKDRIRPQMELFKAVKAPCIVYGETARLDPGRPLQAAGHQAAS